jgi:hypothetical protein
MEDIFWIENACQNAGDHQTVEDFCRFNLENEDKGFGAAKLFGSGEIVMVCPPVEVTHTDSPVAGSKVHFKFGWVSMTIKGLINHAEHMPEPAEGWAHVNARVRDHAYNMLDVEMGVDPEMVALSEAILCSEYDSADAFFEARVERNESEAHYILPRPEKALASPEAALPFAGEYYVPEDHQASGEDIASNSGEACSPYFLETCMCVQNLSNVFVLFTSCLLLD